MEDNTQEASKAVDCTEEDVLASLAAKAPSYTTLEQRLAKFRSASQDYILHNFAAAADAKVEFRLWEAHSKVNQKFRPLLAQFREGEGKKKPVERRKAEKLYLEFIKSSTRFYRGYIQSLASNFSGIPEIIQIARKFNLDTLSADTPLVVDLALKKQIIRSCYSTLVQLGDLSRYRETELQSKSRNWGPATGYYDLATALDPTFGISSNQLAVIALTDQHHLRAVYHLYRAICVENPAPQAQGNLKLEFKKIIKRDSQGKQILSEDVVVEGSPELQTKFLIFHARCFLEEYVGHEDEQNEILHLLSDELRKKPYNTMIRKFCLINISAQDLAAKRVGNDPSVFPSFEIAQHMNIATFTMLLELLLAELRHPAKGIDRVNRPHDGPSQLTPAIRRILPHLRLYSGWLLSGVPQLLANRSLRLQIGVLWQTYAEAISLLIHTFPVVRELPELPYLLDEDRDTLAFSPFSKFIKETRFQDAQHGSKPVYDELVFGPQSSQNEMLYRVKCLVRDAVYLCKKDEFESLPIPLAFANNRFVFNDETAGQGVLSATSLPHAPTSSAPSVNREDGARGKNRRRTTEDGEAPGSMTSDMEEMVKKLTEGGNHKPTPTATSADHGSLSTSSRIPVARTFGDRRESAAQPSTITARDLVQHLRRSSGALPSDVALPSIWTTPFTPRPGETPGSTSRPSTAHYVGTSSPTGTWAQYWAHLQQEEEEIRNRASPLGSLAPTISTEHESSRPHPWQYINDEVLPRPPSQSTSWPSMFGSNALHETVISSRKAEPSPFGAIGEPSPRSNRTPTSGQVG